MLYRLFITANGTNWEVRCYIDCLLQLMVPIGNKMLYRLFITANGTNWEVRCYIDCLLQLMVPIGK